MNRFFLIPFFVGFFYFIFTFNIAAALVDIAKIPLSNKSEIDGVVIQSTKVDSTRIFRSDQRITVKADLESAYHGVVNFDEKCNNKLRDRRIYTDKKKKCRYFNETILEAPIIRKIKKSYTPLADEVDRFLVGRHGYKMGSFFYYDLIIVRKFKNKFGKKVYEVTHRKLDDLKAGSYLASPRISNNGFSEIIGVYTLTEIRPKEVEIVHTYITSTEHWLLNKEIAVRSLYKAFARGSNYSVKAIEQRVKKDK